MPRKKVQHMRVPLTDSEKRSRGTYQKARATKARDLETIRADASEVSESLESIQFSAKDAARSVRKLGVVIPSGRGAASTHKPHPGIRIMAWALAAARSLKRELVFLKEEEALAQAAQKPEHDEFEGLD
jgi:hypothetical protein